MDTHWIEDSFRHPPGRRLRDRWGESIGEQLEDSFGDSFGHPPDRYVCDRFSRVKTGGGYAREFIDFFAGIGKRDCLRRILGCRPTGLRSMGQDKWVFCTSKDGRISTEIMPFEPINADRFGRADCDGDGFV